MPWQNVVFLFERKYFLFDANQKNKMTIERKIIEAF